MAEEFNLSDKIISIEKFIKTCEIVRKINHPMPTGKFILVGDLKEFIRRERELDTLLSESLKKIFSKKRSSIGEYISLATNECEIYRRKKDKLAGEKLI